MRCIVFFTALILLAGAAFPIAATGGSIDLNAYEGDASGNAGASSYDLNYFLSYFPAGGYSAADIDLNLAVIFAPRPPFCGDGICQAVESCSICSLDCGSCPVVDSGGGGGDSSSVSSSGGGG